MNKKTTTQSANQLLFIAIFVVVTHLGIALGVNILTGSSFVWAYMVPITFASTTPLMAQYLAKKKEQTTKEAIC